MKSLVIIPTYNEKNIIRQLIPRVLAAGPDVEVLVVDDNSPDGTGRIVEELTRENGRVHLKSRPGKKGLGSAYIEGIRWGLRRDYEFFFQMDGDGSHRPEYLPQMIAALAEADMVAGSRWIPGGAIHNWSLVRTVLSRAANLYARCVLGCSIRDLTGGFNGYRREVLEALRWDRIFSDGYAFLIETKYRIIQNRFRVKEIPIVFSDRSAGRSKISRWVILEAAWVVWRLKWECRRSKPH